MSIAPIDTLNSYVQSVLSAALHNNGPNGKTTGDSLTATLRSDNSQISPFAQLMSSLQQLQQSDPGEYQQATQAIVTNLQKTAQTAQADGNTTAADRLNQLATDFTNASQSGQLPNIQDLARAVGGHHRHHRPHPAPADSSSSGTNQGLDQILAALQTGAAQDDALNPTSIIINSLSNSDTGSSNA